MRDTLTQWQLRKERKSEELEKMGLNCFLLINFKIDRPNRKGVGGTFMCYMLHGMLQC